MASVIDGFRGTLEGRRAYKVHAAANRCLGAGKFAEAKANFDKALALYDSAVQHGCNHAGILMAYSLVLMRYGRMDEAKEIMLGLGKRNDLSTADKKQLRINYAVCVWKMGDLDHAIELMRQAGQAGMTGTIYNTLGLFLVQKADQTGDYAEAQAFCQKAYEYDEEDPDTLDNLGELYLSMLRRAEAEGDAEAAGSARRQAETYFDRALARKPKLITALYYRAKLHHEAGEDDKARELVRRGLSVQVGMLCPITREDVEALAREVGE